MDQIMNQICQRGKLFLGDEGIVLGKENEMLEACVDVRVRTNVTDVLKVMIVEVSIDPEQPLKDMLHRRHEGLPVLSVLRKLVRIFQLPLHPRKKEVAVECCCYLGWFLVIYAVL